MASEITLTITGMTCGHCVKHVTKALEGVKGVQRAEVNLESGVAMVQGHAPIRALIDAVVEAGYAAS